MAGTAGVGVTAGARGMDDVAALERLADSAMTAAMARHHVPGGILVAVRDTGVVLARGYGSADERGTRVDPERTIFRVASVSKVFTTTAAMRLVEQGRIALDEDVDRHLRRFRVSETSDPPVTLFHLLTHTAGFDERNVSRKARTPDGAVPLGAYLAGRLPDRIRAPGRFFCYSNHGLALAGFLIEEVSGIPFARFMHDSLFAPLGMSRSSFAPRPIVPADLAVGHDDSDPPRPVAYDYVQTAPASMMTSTGSDMARFMIAHLHGEVNREAVPLTSIPEHVRNAVLAIEDHRFWTHQGLDLRSIARAATANFRSSEDGGRIEGGSTISQQLAKLLYFPEPDRTLARKVAEAQVTLQLERAYTKTEILEMYLNTIYLGRGAYGLETAAQSYFGKPARHLTLAEGAFLAGIIHLPARYEWSESDPPERRTQRRADAERRRAVVLDRMYQLGYVSEVEAEDAKAEPLGLLPRTEARWDHPYFVDFVLRQLGVLRNSESDVLDPRYDFLGATFDASGLYRMAAVFDWMDRIGLSVAAIHQHAVGLQSLFLEAAERARIAPLLEATIITPLNGEPGHGNFLVFESKQAAAIHDRLAVANIVTDVARGIIDPKVSYE